MNVQLTVAQFWALVAGGPIAMVLTVIIGIVVNAAVTAAKFDGLNAKLDDLLTEFDPERFALRHSKTKRARR